MHLYRSTSVRVLKGIFVHQANMDYRSKFLAAFGLILLLLVGKISIITDNDVDNKERNQSMLDIDVCTFYDYSLLIDYLLFQKTYKPLIVIISREFTDGINRVRNISQSKRISNINGIKNTNYLKKMYKLIAENYYLFEAHNVYYFVYPVNNLDNFFTIYCQKKLLSDQLGVTFDFVNVKDEHPIFEDILVPLKPNCTNCPLLEYVNKKLQTGESFSELFILREQLFREKTKYTSLKAFDNDYACDSIGFNNNSESESFLMHFNTLLQQIQKNNNNSDESKKNSIFERSLKCFKSRNLDVTNKIFYDNIHEKNLKHPFTGINYLKWIERTVFSLNVNDASFGNICKNQHKIYIFKLFCFIKDISDITSYDRAAWMYTLKQLVDTSLVNKLGWFNILISFYQSEYFLENDLILLELEILEKQMLNESGNWRRVMSTAYNLISNLMGEKSSSKSMLSSPCLFYNYLDTIDALLPEMKLKRLVIIVADSMVTGSLNTFDIESKRVLPKIKREDLHYTKQFVYDEIMRHFYLLQSNDTYYYVYPLIENRYHDILITYFEYKMIKDYSQVLFYFVNAFEYFTLDEVSPDFVIPALPDNCYLFATNCRNRFLSPKYLIDLHQQVYRNYPKYFLFYATFYNNVTEFINNPHSHNKKNNSLEYEYKFYNFLKRKEIYSDTDYLFEDLPCSSLQNLNRRIDIKFSITEIKNLNYIATLTDFAYKNITSINITDNVNLKYFCMNSNIFPFIKFFCFLKINYMEGMLKLIDMEKDYVEDMKKMVENEKNVIIEYLSKTLKWINAMLQIDYSEMYHNEARILNQSELLYTKIPRIVSNDADSFNKIYLVIKEAVFYRRCKSYGKVEN
ncbi:uncharacterized protein LOC122506950 isoform X1 [Leptopilina heterotoma]|uniref:uncharacterized protein LOC122506950 isoform X1 n=1 Tax=Leptopilina heterotoma TaxID=63436 RepID=UPI001CA7D29C|nr:uncharacterized protein LOC122506950 isoform X1 [Leptopilina heterotoma]